MWACRQRCHVPFDPVCTSTTFDGQLTGVFFNAGLWSAPFFLAGSITRIYDLALYSGFRTVKPPEERRERAI